MEKVGRDKRDADREQPRSTERPMPASAEVPDSLSTPPVHIPLSRLRPQQILDFQGRVGNQALQRMMARKARQSWVMRAVEYNPAVEGGRRVDPELATGTLPFTEDGWDGRAIGRNLSQLNPTAPRSDQVRCVQASFLVALVQRGPGAVNEMIANYLRRYRTGLRQPSTPANIRRWYQRSIRNLTPIPDRINGKTATYGDLSTLLTEMYDVYGTAPQGTALPVEVNMMRREGYTAQVLRMANVTQAQAAAQAATLRPGEFLTCAVNVSRLGTGPYNHEILIGAYPDSGDLYLYDPWPVAGDQLIQLDSALNAMSHYFVNQPGETAAAGVMVFDESEAMVITSEGTETGATEAGAESETAAETTAPAEAAAEAGAETAAAGPPTPRTFGIRAKYSPPAPAEAEGAEE